MKIEITEKTIKYIVIAVITIFFLLFTADVTKEFIQSSEEPKPPKEIIPPGMYMVPFAHPAFAQPEQHSEQSGRGNDSHNT